MSLIRLLTTTRSLSDVKNEPSPYRMTEQGLLPKFGPRKQREAGSPPPHVGGYKATAGDGKENLGEGPGDRTDAGCSLKSESSRKPLRPGTGALRWWQKLFGRMARREGREPVQAEFGLDLVRVVRNDLRDAEATSVAKEKTARWGHHALPEKTEEESVFGASRG
jgi:hypothetical protein